MQSTSPSGNGKGSGVGAPDVSPLASGLHPHGGKHPGRQCLVSKRFQTGIFTPSCSRRSRPDGVSPRSTSSPVTPPSRQRFYSWDASDNSEGVDSLSQRWDFPLAYAFPPIALLKSGEEVEDVERHLHPGLSLLRSPDVASIASDAEGAGGSPPAFHGRLSDGSDDGQTAPNLSQPPSSCLKDLWRINSL
jgi:hypothetical protein